MSGGTQPFGLVQIYQGLNSVGFCTHEEVVHKVGLRASGDVVDFGCGYGTFTVPAARITSGTIRALDIDAETFAAASL